ncbi:MAG: glycosyltransferase family 4 protein [Candidatus Omnitrophica bacterium]|nr:glycosyltransferase family 4 protein [Candidatus Omnitrophota bacterium]
MSSERKKVLFLTYNFPPKLGGQEQVIWEVWKEISMRTEAVALVQHDAEVEPESLSVFPAPHEGLLSFFRHLLSKGKELIRADRFDVIVAANGLTAWPAQHLAGKANCECAAILYGLDAIHSSFLYQTMLCRALPRLDRIVSISLATAVEAKKRGARREKLRVIPPGCHANPFLEFRDTGELKRTWGLDDSPVILHAGRLVPRKGIDCFIRKCFPKILAKVPNAKLLLAGGNPEGALLHRGDMAEKVRRTIEEMGFVEKVRVTGRLTDDERVDAFALSDLLVLPVVRTPGDMEGFGIVLLEAAAAGKPTVATRMGGIPDAVEEGVTGYLVDPENYDAMAKRIIELILDPERARTMGEAGRERVIQDFQWKDVAETYVDCLLGEREAGTPVL